MEQDITTMEEGFYWFWPERGREFTMHLPRRRPESYRFRKDRYSGEAPPIAVWVYRRAVGGFLYASPDVADWPIDYAPEGGDEVMHVRVCDLPGTWLKMDEAPELEDVYNRPHFKTPCSPVDTKG